MNLVLNVQVVRQIEAILRGSRNKRATRISLLGDRIGERLIIRSAWPRRNKGERTAGCIGEMFFRTQKKVLTHPGDGCCLTAAETRWIRRRLREKQELAAVVAVIDRGGDLAFYPAYFSRRAPRGVDMSWEYGGSILCQPRSALGGECRCSDQTKVRVDHSHRQIPVNIHGHWITVDQKIARLVRTLNQIPGIATLMSCEGGKPNTRRSERSSVSQAWIKLVSTEHVFVDFFTLMHLNAVAPNLHPRLREITERLRFNIENHLGETLAVTRAEEPFKAWRRAGVPKFYPKLRIENLISTFYWNPADTPKMLASAEQVLRAERNS